MKVRRPSSMYITGPTMRGKMKGVSVRMRRKEMFKGKLNIIKWSWYLRDRGEKSRGQVLILGNCMVEALERQGIMGRT
jgi:hypothetical protein